MEVIHAYQVLFDEIKSESFDLIIASTGVEMRCTHLVSEINVSNTNKLAIGHAERRINLFKTAYDKIFKKNKFEIITENTTESDKIAKFLSGFLKKNNKDNLKILVDYSCMSKKWYGTIINYMLNHDLPNINKIEIYFSYTPAEFSKFTKPKSITEFKPVFDFEYKKTNKPVALILGLGCEEGLSDLVVDKIKPDYIHCFYADPAFDDQYVKMIKNCHANLLENLDPKHITAYPISNIEKADAILTSICLNLRLNYKVVLVPNGAKSFALISMLLTLRYPDVELWECTTINSNPRKDRKAISDPVVYKTIFSIDV